MLSVAGTSHLRNFDDISVFELRVLGKLVLNHSLILCNWICTLPDKLKQSASHSGE